MEMCIYLLKRKTDKPRWDVYNGHVIAASSSQRARTMAAEIAADEKAAVWLDPNCSTCEVIGLQGDDYEHVILSDFNAG